jgi:putative radical SAM enzyme (TIGR03279 family)
MFVLYEYGYYMQINHDGKNKPIHGLKVKKLSVSSPFFQSGMKKGDIIESINDQVISDELDFHFFSADSVFEVQVVRNSQTKKLVIYRTEGSFSEIEFYENPINCCRNKCVFCFIDQMPKGLRRGLYIKDEDFKHSFLNGNYVTLSGAKPADLQKIALIGLSPLYISVHATDSEIRKKMLGNMRAPDIMEQLQFLRDNGIAFHTQIVVCPGFNDGDVLHRTILDLFSFSESLLSIAVVPVGLTDFRKIPLQPVTKDIAQNVCTEMMELSDKQLTPDGLRRLFIADEFFVKADLPLPPKKYYEDYPQIENGIGLLRQLLEEWKQYKKEFKAQTFAPVKKRKNYLVITSKSAYPFLKKIITEAQVSQPAYHIEFTLVAVTNRYFGEMVTVAGLLTASDVTRVIKAEMRQKKYETVILPRIMFNYAGFTLDGYSPQRISLNIGTPVKIAGAVQELFTGGMRGICAGKR